MAYIDSRKQKVHPAVAFLLRKYLQELQELKCAYENDATAGDAPRDAFAAFARRHQPRTSMRYAAEQEGVLKARHEAKAAQKKAKAKARPPQADQQLTQELLEARKKQGIPDFEPSPSPSPSPRP